MAKRIITISREFGSGGRFIGEEVAKKLGIAYYDKKYHWSDCRKVRLITGIYSGKCGIISEKKVCSHMHFPVVISQENLWRTWCMRHREILF